jgi:membrane protease YdiL (CAAX protease family)
MKEEKSLLRPSRTRVVIRILSIFLLGLIVLMISSSLAMLVAREDPASATSWKTPFMTHTTMLAASLLAMLALGKRKFARFGFQAARDRFLKPVIVLGLGMGALGTLVQWLIGAEEIAGLESLSFLQVILLIWIYASVSEEVFFRGLLQTALESFSHLRVRVFGIHLSFPVIFAAIFFSAMHFGLLTTGADVTAVVIIVLFALVLGLACGYFREKTGSLYPAILLHSLGNVGGTLLSKVIEVAS